MVLLHQPSGAVSCTTVARNLNPNGWLNMFKRFNNFERFQSVQAVHHGHGDPVQ